MSDFAIRSVLLGFRDFAFAIGASVCSGWRVLLKAVVLLIVAVPASHLNSAWASEGRRVALVVGNAAYHEAPLRNPVNDARALAAALREQGFEVLLRENATKSVMERAFADFGEKLTEGATALFFFAGHGMQVGGRNYLVPVDAKISSEQRVRLESLDLDLALDQMSGARVKVSIAILDACRNNPYERRFRSVSGGLAQINAPEGTLIAYATAPGKVAADGEGSNGLYTEELLKALRQPGQKVEDVFKQVRVAVSRRSNGAQTPWEASSLVGDFYFLPPAAVTPAAPTTAVAPTATNAAEIEFWNSVKNSRNLDELKAYLSEYPRGSFARLAQLRLQTLQRETEQTRPQSAADESPMREAAERRPTPPVTSMTAAVSSAALYPLREELKGDTHIALQKVAAGIPVAYADLDGRQFFAQQNYIRGPRGFEIKFDFSSRDPTLIVVHGNLEIETSGGKGGTSRIVSSVNCPIFNFDKFKQNLKVTAYCRDSSMIIGDLATMSVTFMYPGLNPEAVTLIDSSLSESHQQWSKGVRDNNTAAFFQNVLREALIKSAHTRN